MESKGEPDHFLEILENLEILEILEIPSSEETPFVMTPFSCPGYETKNGQDWRSFSESSTLIVASSMGMMTSMSHQEVEAALYGRYKGATPEYRQHARMLRQRIRTFTLKSGTTEWNNRPSPVEQVFFKGALDKQNVASLRHSLIRKSFAAERREFAYEKHGFVRKRLYVKPPFKLDRVSFPIPTFTWARHFASSLGACDSLVFSPL